MSTARKFRIGIIVSLTSLLVSLLLVEFLLRVVDPTGAYDYFASAAAIRRAAVPHETRGYVLPSGEHRLKNFTVHVGADRNRVVPDTSPQGDCVIAALGDSVTFGFGVNDEDTWVNLIARRYDGVQFVNTAYGGYNSANIRAAAEDTPAGGYIYVIIDNDEHYPEVWHAGWQDEPTPSGIAAYLLPMLKRVEVSQAARWPDFEADMQAVLGREDMMAFAFSDGGLTPWLQERYPEVVILSRWTSNNSRADAHPDAVGHTQIAEGMLPYLDGWLEETCS